MAIAVKALKDGSLVSIANPTEKVSRLLEAALSYSRLNYEHGVGMSTAPKLCYKYVTDPTGVFPKRLVTNSGYMTKISKTLADAGYAFLVKDLRPEKPGTFTPYWDQLGHIKWKWQQKETLEKLLRRYYGQVDVPTAYGKSFLIWAICRLLLRARIAIATHSVDVIEQIQSELSQTIPNVGLVSGRTKNYGDRITCYAGKSLHKCVEPVDLLLADEDHEFGTDDYLAKLAAPAFRFARRWGFSANVGDRSDKADFEVEGAFGPVVVHIPYQEAVRHKCVVQIIVDWYDVDMDHDPTEGLRQNYSKERHAIWRNAVRNGIIAAQAIASSKDQVLISVDKIEHAMYLKKLLPDFVLCYAENGITPAEKRTYIRKGFIKPDEPEMTYRRKRDLKERFASGDLQWAIATSVWRRGVDFRRLSTMIRADAVSSMIADTQIPGRTSRLCLEIGKQAGRIVDLTDKFSKWTRMRSNRRKGHYKSHGWIQRMPSDRTVEGQLRQRTLSQFTRASNNG